MKGVVFTGDRNLQIRDFSDPTPWQGQVVIKMGSSGLYGSDLRPYRSSADDLASRLNTICGHEPCGTVAELGSGARGVQVGDRVIIHHYSGCQRCKHCETGWTQLCQNGQKVYGTHADGGNADYELVEDYMCVPMPDGLSFEEGAAPGVGLILAGGILLGEKHQNQGEHGQGPETERRVIGRAGRLGMDPPTRPAAADR